MVNTNGNMYFRLISNCDRDFGSAFELSLKPEVL